MQSLKVALVIFEVTIDNHTKFLPPPSTHTHTHMDATSSTGNSHSSSDQDKKSWSAICDRAGCAFPFSPIRPVGAKTVRISEKATGHLNDKLFFYLLPLFSKIAL